ncbi:MAG: hypothetical protein WBM50_14835, partial [Acidimicrobiales bacterium]
MAWLVRFSTNFAADADRRDNDDNDDDNADDNADDNDDNGPAEAPDREGIELFTSQLWDLATTGVHHAPDGEIVAGFETESDARSAAQRMSARHPAVVGRATVEPAPPIDR